MKDEGAAGWGCRSARPGWLRGLDWLVGEPGGSRLPMGLRCVRVKMAPGRVLPSKLKPSVTTCQGHRPAGDQDEKICNSELVTHGWLPVGSTAMVTAPPDWGAQVVPFQR